jgi:hypothetical protein
MTIDTQKLLADHGSIAQPSPTRLERLKIRALQQLDHGGRGKSIYVGANEVIELVAAARALADTQASFNAQAAEIERLRGVCQEAINLLGMDRPVDPTDVLRAALQGEPKC